MRKQNLCTYVLMAALLITPFYQAKAYDEDTHFYATYAMARYAGIAHPVAAEIATNAQWMDETYMSSPMIPLLYVGIRVRRLLHFASTAQDNDLTSGIFGLKLNSETVPNHPMASELLMEGLKEGSLLKASASLHVLEDSYAHAGTPAQIGHAASGWHWPDRPYDAPQKYWEMVGTVFKALVAIRDLLPARALDTEFTDKARSNTPNYQLDAATLAKNYSSIPQIKNTIEKNMMKDPEYVKTAIEYIMKRSQDDLGYIEPRVDLDIWLKKIEYNGQRDTRETLRDLVLEILAFEKSPQGIPVLIKPKILASLGFSNDPEYIKSWGGTPDTLVKAGCY